MTLEQPKPGGIQVSARRGKSRVGWECTGKARGGFCTLGKGEASFQAEGTAGTKAQRLTYGIR